MTIKVAPPALSANPGMGAEQQPIVDVAHLLVAVDVSERGTCVIDLQIDQHQMNHRYESHNTWTRVDEPEKDAAQTGHEDRIHEMRRQKNRNKKGINRPTSKKNELSPPAKEEQRNGCRT